MENNTYDVIIVGGGPSGLTAAIYSLRSNLRVLLLEQYICGGQILNTYEIKNYPGFENISGPDLAIKMEGQAKSLGLEEKFESVIDFDFSKEIKEVKTKSNKYFSKAVILCMGAKARKLGIKREEDFIGKGVSYCAVCDGAFFKGKDVAIVGGGNSAVEDVSYLSNLANKTYLINRSDKFRADSSLVASMKKLESQNKILIKENTIVFELLGRDKLEGINLRNTQTNQELQLSIDGLFIEIGRIPDTGILQNVVQLDDRGYILTNDSLETSVPGVFAAGDVRKKDLRQIITAAGDGALASASALKYIQSRK